MPESLTQESAFATVRALVPDPSRSEALIALWEKQGDGSGFDLQILLAASVVMIGQQVPSPVTALSVSQGLAGQPVWEALVHLAQALGSLGSRAHLSPAFSPVVLEAVQASAKKLDEFGSRGPAVQRHA
jgi:hypothetical protein